jgi:hypothetical protein
LPDYLSLFFETYLKTIGYLRFIVYSKIVVGSGHRFDCTHIREHVTKLPMVEVPVLLQVLDHALSLLQELKCHVLLSLLEEIHRLLVDFPDKPDFLKGKVMKRIYITSETYWKVVFPD